MSSLRDAEVRRLLAHLRQYIQGAEHIAGVEDELRDEFAEEFLREPDLLIYFPELIEKFIIAGMEWELRIIPHAHLRIIQRGISSVVVSALFTRFIEEYVASGQVISIGHYSIVGKATPRAVTVTVRADVDVVADEKGQAHIVTIF